MRSPASRRNTSSPACRKSTRTSPWSTASSSRTLVTNPNGSPRTPMRSTESRVPVCKRSTRPMQPFSSGAARAGLPALPPSAGSPAQWVASGVGRPATDGQRFPLATRQPASEISERLGGRPIADIGQPTRSPVITETLPATNKRRSAMDGDTRVSRDLGVHGVRSPGGGRPARRLPGYLEQGRL